MMVPTQTRVLSSLGAFFGVSVADFVAGREAKRARRERESGGRLMRDMKRRRKITRLKGASVRPLLREKGLVSWCTSERGDKGRGREKDYGLKSDKA